MHTNTDVVWFTDFALELLYNAGHIDSERPILANRTINQTLYEDSNVRFLLTSSDRAVLKQVLSVSHLIDFSNNLKIFSVFIKVAESFKEEKARQIHSLLHYYWKCDLSIVIFGSSEKFSFSFANSATHEYYCSEWFNTDEITVEEVINRIDIGNITVYHESLYFYDFVYAVGKDIMRGNNDLGISKKLISSLENKGVIEQIPEDSDISEFSKAPQERGNVELLEVLLEEEENTKIVYIDNIREKQDSATNTKRFNSPYEIFKLVNSEEEDNDEKILPDQNETDENNKTIVTQSDSVAIQQEMVTINNGTERIIETSAKTNDADEMNMTKRQEEKDSSNINKQSYNVLDYSWNRNKKWSRFGRSLKRK